MTITAEHHLFSMKYSKFLYYICFWHPQHGSTSGFVSLLITDCFFTLQVFVGICHTSLSVDDPAVVIRIKQKGMLDMMFPVHI